MTLIWKHDNLPNKIIWLQLITTTQFSFEKGQQALSKE